MALDSAMQQVVEVTLGILPTTTITPDLVLNHIPTTPLGWALTLFQVENSHVMEWSLWWRIDREKGPFAPTTCILFVDFNELKLTLRLIKLQL